MTIYVNRASYGLQYLVQNEATGSNMKTLSVLFRPVPFRLPHLCYQEAHNTMPSYPHIAVRFLAISSRDSVTTNTSLVFLILDPKGFLLPPRTRLSKKSEIGPITSGPPPLYLKCLVGHCGAHQTGIRRGRVISPWSGLLRSAKGLGIGRTKCTFKDPDICESSGADDEEQSGFWRTSSVRCVGLLG